MLLASGLGLVVLFPTVPLSRDRKKSNEYQFHFVNSFYLIT